MGNNEKVILTADITSAFVANNATSVADLPTIISSIYSSLSKLDEVEPSIPETFAPAVSASASVRPNKVTCMTCGWSGKMLKRHIMTVHKETLEQYRARWSLKANHPLTAPDYSLQRKDLATAIGLGRHPNSGRQKLV